MFIDGFIGRDAVQMYKNSKTIKIKDQPVSMLTCHVT